MSRILTYLAFLQAIVATSGSLFFSEVLHFTPCTLCWYQRILMYPLVAILAVGILRRDKGVYLYVLPLSIIGWFIALYHNLLQWGVIVEPCTVGVPCVTRYAGWFGFITIPLLSLTAFTVITICMLLLKRFQRGLDL